MNSTMTQPAIILDKVGKAYGHVQAVRGISLSVSAGELVGIVGPDGAGKTTLTRLAAGVLRPDSGAVVPESQGRVGYLAGRFSLYPELTVWENLSFFASLYGMPRQTVAAEGARLLDWVGLTPFRDRHGGELSGGMRQKLALICAVIHQPPVLILDEPTTAVDPVARADFWTLLREQADRGRAVLVTTPYLDEAEFCHRVVLLHAGRALAIDTPTNLRAQLPCRMVMLTADTAPAPTGDDSTASAKPGQLRNKALVAAESLPGRVWAEPLGLGIRVALNQDAPVAAPPGYALTECAPTLEDVFIWLANERDGDER